MSAAAAAQSLVRLAQELAADHGQLRERAPHVATRVIVDVDGQGIVRALYDAFDRMNGLHFGGALAPPLILVTFTAPRALGDHAERDPHGLRSLIRLPPRTIECGFLFACDILIHEMVHTWCAEVARDTEAGYRGHGPVFAGQCNAIGRRLGLGEVGVKRRKGLPDCAQWPVCVRPPGYYGNDHAEHERGKRSSTPCKLPSKLPVSRAAEPMVERPQAAAGGRPRVRNSELELAAGLCDRAAGVFGERRCPRERKMLTDSARLLRALATQGAL